MDRIYLAYPHVDALAGIKAVWALALEVYEAARVRSQDYVGIVNHRDFDKFTAFCDSGAFKEGKCQIWPEKPDFNCPEHKKDVCCIVCESLDNGCEVCCERINPDD